MTGTLQTARARNPRILVVTPEITYLPAGMGNMANTLTAKAGGLADVSASLVSALFDLGADVHVTLPHYRRMFSIDVGNLISEELRLYRAKLPDARLHLAEDRCFYYRGAVYGDYDTSDVLLALAFQREVINNILPVVEPDLIHCNDWMTGLIPAAARRLGIPCLFTLHNIHTRQVILAAIEDRGIDAAAFWPFLYYSRMPANYEETRATNPVDLLTSGIFAAHFINTVSPTFLQEIVSGHHDFIPAQVRAEIAYKQAAQCAEGILNAPDARFQPATDVHLARRYGPADHPAGKRANKQALQERLGLRRVEDAPLFFWPSRLDPVQKGCQLLADILYPVVSDYWAEELQIAVVANGAYLGHFRDIVQRHEFHERVAVCEFDEELSHLAYAAADYLLMPSRFEPCGLPQMIGVLYGTLPVVHDTGGIHDTITPLDPAADEGNGFVFQVYDSAGLRWAIDRAMDFHALAPPVRARQIARIMSAGARTFTLGVCAQRYVGIYERMLKRRLVAPF